MRRRHRANGRDGPPIGVLSFLSCLVLSSLLWASGFTPGMAKRDGPGPFDAAPIVQGDPNNLDGRTDDLLSFPRGTQVRNNFYTNFDTDQGSVVLWWTPEYGAASLSGAGDHYIWYVSASYFLAYEYDTDRFHLSVGGQSLTVASAIASGTTYALVARWDSRNTLDGVNYAALSINGVTTFGVTTQPAASAPAASLFVGSDGSTGAASGIVEGLTVYRRPLFDGTRGIDAGNGNEIVLISAGPGADPTIVTGSWDVVLCLPTNSVRGALVSGTGEAWSHPHLSNRIPGNSSRGGFMLAGTPAVDGWNLEGTPTSVTVLAPGEKIFDGGYKSNSSGANEGIYQDVAVVAGEDWVARAVASSDGTCQPRLVLYDQTGAAEIGSLTGTTTSTRVRPDVLVLTGEAPAGSTTLRVKLVNAAATGACSWHQVEVLSNTIDNPSMERWQGTDPDIANGWTNGGLDAGVPTRETTTVHSGAAAFRFNGGPDLDRAEYDPGQGTNGAFRAYGVFAHFLFGQAPFPAFGGSTVWYLQSSATVNFALFLELDPGAWKQRMGVSRSDGSGDPTFYVGQFNGPGDFIVDDFYAYTLDPVSVTVAPATGPNSVENVGELRIDGRDVYVEDGVGSVTTTSALIAFDWRPRHGAAQGVAFAETTADDAYLVSFFGNSTNFIQVFWDSANTIRMRYNMAGSTASGTWNASGVVVGGTKYTLEVAYTGGGAMTFKVNGVTRITLSPIPAAFAVAPNNIHYGSHWSGNLQGDAAIDLNTTAVELESFTARGSDGSVELQWKTASELDNLGFHLYRAESEQGPYLRISATPIPGLGSSAVGARYSYRDSGLRNGTRYFYKLEDIDTSGVRKEHKPISAVPEAGAVHSREDETAARVTYGEPDASSFRILGRDGRGVTLELVTGGFHAEPEADGRVRLRIPDFVEGERGGAFSLPVRQAWVDVLAGRQVRLTSVRATDVVEFSGLTPAAVEAEELFATRAGSVRLGRRPRKRGAIPKAAVLFPEEYARLVEVGFHGDVKKARVELAPLRWDAAHGRLTLARRLVVELSFVGREPDEHGLDARDGRRGRRHREVAPHDPSSVLVRLAVREKGLYRVPFEEILGSRAAPVPASSLGLSRQGRAVPLHVEPEGEPFGPGSSLYFFSEGESLNPYGDRAVYELTRGAGARMPVVRSSPAGAPLAFLWHDVTREENRLYQAGLVSAEDPWLWDLVFAPATKSYGFVVTGLASVAEPAQLTVWLHGASDSPASPDQHLRLFVNGTLVSEPSWDGKRPRRVEAALPPGLLHEGENSLSIENVGDTGAAYSSVMLDRFVVTFARVGQAESGHLEGRAGRAGVATVGGVGERPRVVEVTGETTRWIENVATTPDGEARFAVEEGRRYRVAGARALLRPEVLRIPRGFLKSERNQADYLVIGPSAFLPAAEPLLDHRRRQGLRSMAVAVEDVYSEFGFGESRPEAIRELLSYAYHHWRAPSPRYVLLLGDGTYDFKDYLGTGLPNRVPPLLTRTRYLWTASDPGYALVNGDDALPDLAIGRLPAATLAEAETLVRKVLAFETRATGPRGPVVLVADDPDRAGDFEAEAEAIASELIAGRDVEKIYLRELGPSAARGRIVDAFDRGSWLMNYLGHGGIHLWASERIFDNEAVASLSEQARQPLVLTMNCLNGYFHFPYFDSLSESLLKAEAKGAVAAFSPSGLSQSASAHRYHKALLREVSSGAHRRLGDAVSAAQAAYLDSGDTSDLLSIYHLFGDPALLLR